jgi:hypothetical protein
MEKDQINMLVAQNIEALMKQKTWTRPSWPVLQI